MHTLPLFLLQIKLHLNLKLCKLVCLLSNIRGNKDLHKKTKAKIKKHQSVRKWLTNHFEVQTFSVVNYSNTIKRFLCFVSLRL